MRRIALLLLFIFATAISAYAQSGTIQGTLVDPQGNTIANAKVMAIDEAKGLVVRETNADKDGAFLLLPLLRGTYTVQVEAQGFKKTRPQRIGARRVSDFEPRQCEAGCRRHRKHRSGYGAKIFRHNFRAGDRKFDQRARLPYVDAHAAGRHHERRNGFQSGLQHDDGRLKLQYRAEFFNIFNHTQWFGINTSISNVAN
jgi:carboxypeptidase family protein